MNSACALLLLFVEEAEAVAVAEAGDRGFKNPARGFTLARLELILISPSKSLQIINLSLRIQFGEASKN